MAFSYSKDLFLVCFLGHICLFEARFFRIFNPVSLQTKDSKWKVREAPECQPLNPTQNRGDDQVSRKSLRFGRQNPYGCWGCTKKKGKNLGTQTPGCIWEAGCWTKSLFLVNGTYLVWKALKDHTFFYQKPLRVQCHFTLPREWQKIARKRVSPEVTWSHFLVWGTARLMLLAKGPSFSFNIFIRRKSQLFPFVGSDLAL